MPIPELTQRAYATLSRYCDGAARVTQDQFSDQDRYEPRRRRLAAVGGTWELTLPNPRQWSYLEELFAFLRGCTGISARPVSHWGV